MKFELWLIGKNDSYISEGISIYEKRIKRYIQFEVKYFESNRKGTTPELIKNEESKLIMRNLKQRDYLIILDEHGKDHSSPKFAAYIEKILISGTQKIVFLIGGAYGVDDALK